MKPIWLCLGLVMSSTVLACSGPNIQENIIMMRAYGIMGLGIQAMLAVPMYRWFRTARKGPGHILVSLSLAAIHPAWYWDGYSGDCGTTHLMISTGLLGVVVGLAIWQYEIAVRAKPT